jgi:hypothetical protein
MILMTSGVLQFKLLILSVLCLIGVYVYFQYLHPNTSDGESGHDSLLKLPILFLGIYVALLVLLFIL